MMLATWTPAWMPMAAHTERRATASAPALRPKPVANRDVDHVLDHVLLATLGDHVDGAEDQGRGPDRPDRPVPEHPKDPPAEEPLLGDALEEEGHRQRDHDLRPEGDRHGRL